VEKLVYLLWSRPEDEGEAFVREMRGEVAKRLVDAGARGLALALVDDAARAVSRARITHMTRPLAGAASFWLECADARGPAETLLERACARSAGYAVLESVPLPGADRLGPPGARSPGISMLALLERPAHLAREVWLERWLEDHRTVAIETQATFRYVRNVVVRSLTADAPPYEGIVEEGFAEDAILDPAKWYAAEGEPARLREHTRRMLESCQRFLDLARVESHPTSLYRIEA
jgi:hypothetical protein